MGKHYGDFFLLFSSLMCDVTLPFFCNVEDYAQNLMQMNILAFPTQQERELVLSVGCGLGLEQTCLGMGVGK
jgi:hypothetical protein